MKKNKQTNKQKQIFPNHQTFWGRIFLNSRPFPLWIQFLFSLLIFIFIIFIFFFTILQILSTCDLSEIWKWKVPKYLSHSKVLAYPWWLFLQVGFCIISNLFSEKINTFVLSVVNQKKKMFQESNLLRY